MKKYTERAGATASDCDAGRVSTEGGYVSLDPAECHHLVLEAVVTWCQSIAGAQETWPNTGYV